MKKFLILAGLALAFVMPGAAQAHPGMCDKTFTVAMAQKAARANWQGTRIPTVADGHHMYKYMVCQRNPHARAFVAWFYRHQKSLNYLRRYPPAPVLSAHARCIIQAESTWNPKAVNGQYEGIGQWSPWSWAHYGGLRYASRPIYASLADQERVLMGEGDAGMTNQQGKYDRCG